MKQVTVDIGKIKPSNLVRENVGDIQPLVASIRKYGLYQPFLIDSSYRLQKNFRTYAAAKAAGIRRVLCLILDPDNPKDALELQVKDNTLHLPYTPSERAAIAQRLLPEFRRRAESRKRSGKAQPSENISEGGPGEALVQVAELLGTSKPTLQKEIFITEAASRDPAAFGDLRRKMDETGKVNGLHKELVLRQKWEENRRRYAAAPDDRWVVQGDFREHIARQDFIPDGSTSLILTDAPYLEKYIPLYGELARFGAAKLQPGAFLITYYWGKFIEQVITSMSAHLKLIWVCGVYMKRPAYYRPLNIRSQLKLLLVYRKPPLDEIWWSPFTDVVSGGKAKDNYEWEQPVEEAAHFIKALCLPGGVVVDPFTGSGTTLVAAVLTTRS